MRNFNQTTDKYSLLKISMTNEYKHGVSVIILDHAGFPEMWWCFALTVTIKQTKIPRFCDQPTQASSPLYFTIL